MSMDWSKWADAANWQISVQSLVIWVLVALGSWYLVRKVANATVGAAFRGLVAGLGKLTALFPSKLVFGYGLGGLLFISGLSTVGYGISSGTPYMSQDSSTITLFRKMASDNNDKAEVDKAIIEKLKTDDVASFESQEASRIAALPSPLVPVWVSILGGIGVTLAGFATFLRTTFSDDTRE